MDALPPTSLELYLDKDVVEVLRDHEFRAVHRLLSVAWRQTPAATLPKTPALLARWSGLSPSQWSESAPVLLSLFPEGPDGRLHIPAMQRLAKVAQTNQNRARLAAMTRWHNGLAPSMLQASLEDAPSNAPSTAPSMRQAMPRASSEQCSKHAPSIEHGEGARALSGSASAPQGEANDLSASSGGASDEAQDLGARLRGAEARLPTARRMLDRARWPWANVHQRQLPAHAAREFVGRSKPWPRWYIAFALWRSSGKERVDNPVGYLIDMLGVGKGMVEIEEPTMRDFVAALESDPDATTCYQRENPEASA